MRWALFAAISLACVARAHDADVIYVLVELRDGALTESVTLTGSSLGLLAPVDADGDGALSQGDLDARAAALRAGVWEDMPLTAGGVRCALGATQARLREGFVELFAVFDCGAGALSQDFRFLRVLPANYRVVLGSQLDGERGGAGVAQGSFSTLPIPRPKPAGAWSARDLERGFEQGLSRALRPDALACLAALLLTFSRWRRGLLGLAALAGGLCAGSFFAWPAPVLVTLVALTLAVAVAREPSVGLGAVLGLALAARAGGGAVAEVLGQSAGWLVVWLPLGPAFLALGVLLHRRAKWRTPARAVVAAAAVVLLVA